jgi:hypothetical protein
MLQINHLLERFEDLVAMDRPTFHLQHPHHASQQRESILLFQPFVPLQYPLVPSMQALMHMTLSFQMNQELSQTEAEL